MARTAAILPTGGGAGRLRYQNVDLPKLRDDLSRLAPPLSHSFVGSKACLREDNISGGRPEHCRAADKRRYRKCNEIEIAFGRLEDW